MPKISIIIPTYNRGNLILDSVDSVFAQSLKDFEILVIDDGSTDNTKKVLQNYAKDIKYISIEHTGLPAVTRNVGLKNAKGEYIAFLDSDDIWLPQKLEKQINILDTNPEIGLVCSNAFILRSESEKSDELYLKNMDIKQNNIFYELLKGNFIIASSVIVRRSVLDKSGIFPENPELRAIEDYSLWLNIALISNIYYLPDALVLYREHSGSIRTLQTQLSYINASILIQKTLNDKLVDNPDINLKRTAKDIEYNIELYEYDRYVILNNNKHSVIRLIHLAIVRPKNIYRICRFTLNAIFDKSRTYRIIHFISPWTLNPIS